MSRQILKPCPFCGGNASYVIGYTVGILKVGDGVRVVCDDCDRSDGFIYTKKTPAKKSWNTRPGSAK